MSLTARDVHRDLAYFYVGVLISFAFSGIFFNHRDTWDPKKYTHTEKEITVSSVLGSEVNEALIKSITSELKIEDKLKRFSSKDSSLKIAYEMNELELNLRTGKGTHIEYRTTPILGQMANLHKANSQWWIYYSDGFGIAILVISISGMFLVKGKNSFRGRGWKLALAGILFPLLFIIFLM